MAANARHRILGLALVATLAATAWTWFSGEPSEDAEVLPAVQRGVGRPAAQAVTAPQAVTSSAATVAVAAEAGPAPRWTEAAGDLFAARRWEAPAGQGPATATVADAPAPPAPPALPFRYLGKLVEGTQVVAFLARGSDVVLARQGDVVSGWRVDALRLDGMRFTHLQQHVQQDLVFGSSN